MLRWYALHTHPHRELQVADLLSAKGVEVFLPMIPQRRRRIGWIDVPLFPCYLFARLDLAASGILDVQWTPGLRRVVAFGNEPVPIPDDVIERLQKRVEEVAMAGGLPAHNFRPGDRLIVRDGPLQGLEVVFEGPMRPSERVRVLVDFLGRLSRAEIPVDAVERAQPTQEETRRRPPRRTRGRGRRIRSSSGE
ncbi:MAG: hypothetical protein Kow0047_17290 [Anaerolineae bacterium]